MCFSSFAYLLFLALIVGGLAWGIHASSRAGHSRGPAGLGTETPCPRCRRINPTHARYCGHCGLALG